MKKVYLLGLAITSMVAVQAQDCSSGRYKNEVFQDFDQTLDIVYGNNTTWNNSGTIDLELDVYEPQGDTEAERPLLIFIHGGTFILGSKEESDVKPLAEIFARKGFVTSSMNYRLGMKNILTGPDESDASEAVMRATQDARAAVRFFKKSVVEDANPYGIDTNNIFLVGSSAGGFTALHLAYLDETSEIPPFIDMSDPSLTGGLEGTTGNAGYNSTVTGIINLAGALGDVNWMQAGDIPVLSLHGDEDGTVPFGTDMIQVGGNDIMIVDGSETVHTRAEDISLKHCFKPFYGAGHVPHNGDAIYTDTTQAYMTQFLLSFVCGETDYCNYIETTGSIAEQSQIDFKLYPNPATSVINIESENHIDSYSIVDINGRLMEDVTSTKSFSVSVNTQNYNKGIYFIRINTNKGSNTKKFIVE
ncbi:MAG: T9SS type A sorting domain-containing protein [Brumimicrobium sp.]